MKAHQVLGTKTKNQTRWLGLYQMADHNRRLSKHICKSLTGDEHGYCEEAPAAPVRAAVVVSSDDDSDGASSSGDDQEEGDPQSPT